MHDVITAYLGVIVVPNPTLSGFPEVRADQNCGAIAKSLQLDHGASITRRIRDKPQYSAWMASPTPKVAAQERDIVNFV